MTAEDDTRGTPEKASASDAQQHEHDITRSLPTDEYLSDDPETQAALEDTEALFSFGGDSSENQGGFFNFGGFF